MENRMALKKKDQKFPLITPRQSQHDLFKVYDKPFLGDQQFDVVRNKKGGLRTIYVDPELTFRLANLV